jgi:deoxyxylulose-5-phosphate synthase
VVAIEEGLEKGGFSGAVAELLADEGMVKPLLRLAVADHIVHHGDQKKLLDEEGLSQARIEASLEAFAQRI